MPRAQAEALIAYYRRHGRRLPWREKVDPYPILVSEVMLQQTQVETVIPYFHRFLAAFPSVEDLAGAATDEVLGLWSGLGYYSRARRLQETARTVVARGGFPDSQEELAQLPGVGPYTAAAVASIAYNIPAVALDTNALRVLCRYYGETGDPGRRALQNRLRRLTLPAIPRDSAGDFTQALIELGALICKPRRADCERCPLSEGCQAHRRQIVAQIPPPKKKREPVTLHLAAAFIQLGTRILLCRQQGPLLKGLWTPPWVELDKPGQVPDFSGDPPIKLDQELARVKHGITFRRLRISVYRGTLLETGCAESEDYRWFDTKEMQTIGLPSFSRKILAAATRGA